MQAADRAIVLIWKLLERKTSPKFLVFWSAFAAHALVYWGVGLLILAVDKSKKPAWLYRYKIQPSDCLSLSDAVKCIKRVALNQLLFAVLPLYLASRRLGESYALKQLRRPVPTARQMIWQLCVCLALQEIGFFFSHRALHHPRVYKTVHKMHHEFRAPTSLASEYAHPVEFVVADILPGVLGPSLLHTHALTNMIWTAFGMFITTAHHSGYQLPFLRGFLAPDFHDYHHMAFNSNFGTTRTLDWLFGTDKHFRAYLERRKNANKPATQQEADEEALKNVLE